MAEEHDSGPAYSKVSLVSDSGLSERAARIRAEHDRANTLTAYATDWRTWLAFCLDEHLDPLTVSHDALVVYAAWLGGAGPGARLAPESIRRRLTGVLAGWRDAGVDYPRHVTKAARRWVNGYADQLVAAGDPTGRGQAPAATVKMLRAITKATPDTVGGRRDVALVLLGFAIAARRSELAHLDTSDITSGDDGGLYVHVRRSKSGARRLAVPRGQHEPTCPVVAWHRWAEARGLHGGAAFRRVDRLDRVGGRLSPAAVGAVVTRAAQRAGVEVRLTGHSLRAGLATEARRAGHSVERICDQGGWKASSPAVYGYIRRVDEWTNNPLVGIGL